MKFQKLWPPNLKNSILIYLISLVYLTLQIELSLLLKIPSGR
nr:MAG TPA: hypothetical protein [Bacteriophage sp.]